MFCKWCLIVFGRWFDMFLKLFVDFYEFDMVFGWEFVLGGVLGV